jgi:hypothetical protein
LGAPTRMIGTSRDVPNTPTLNAPEPL